MNWKILVKSTLKATGIMGVILSGSYIILLAVWKFLDWLEVMGFNPILCCIIAMFLLIILPMFISLIYCIYTKETKPKF